MMEQTHARSRGKYKRNKKTYTLSGGGKAARKKVESSYTQSTLSCFCCWLASKAAAVKIYWSFKCEWGIRKVVVRCFAVIMIRNSAAESSNFAPFCHLSHLNIPHSLCNLPFFLSIHSSSSSTTLLLCYTITTMSTSTCNINFILLAF